MKLSELLLYLRVHGEAIVSIEDVKKLIASEDDDFDVKVLHLDPPINPEIYNYYGERKDND